jgi:hypothetical protein
MTHTPLGFPVEKKCLKNNCAKRAEIAATALKKKKLDNSQ